MSDSTSAATPETSRAQSAAIAREELADPRAVERDVALALGALLILLLLMVFGQGLFGGFVYDDERLVVGNPRIASWSGVLEGLRSPYWSFDEAAEAAQVGYWRPLSVLFLALGRFLGAGEPFGFHLVSLLVHLAATLAAWRFARLLTGSLVLGWLAAALFAVHPVQVESVAWISAINDPLCGLFSLLALTAWLQWRRRGSPAFALATPLFFALALLSKEQALALPLLLLALELVPDHERRAGRAAARPARSREDWMRDYIPIGVVVLAYWAARALVFSEVSAGFFRLNADYHLPFLRGLGLRVELLGGFLRLLAWPAELAVFRGLRPVLPAGDPALTQAGIALGVYLVALLIAWRKRKRSALAMLLTIPLALLPVLAQPEAAGNYPLSDRYLYLPVFAFVLVLASLAWHSLPKALGKSVCGLVLLVFAWRSGPHIAHFNDNESFYREAAAVSPRVPAVHWGLGRELLEEYKLEHKPEQLEEAFLHFLISLSLGTDYGDKAPKLGPGDPIHERMVEMQDLISRSRPEDRKPDPTVFVEVWDRLQANLGQGWCYLLRAEASDEFDLDPALLVFQETARAFPESHWAQTGLGVALMQKGRLDEAIEVLGEAVRLNNLNPEAWHNLGQALRRKEQWEAARNAFERALFLRPDNVPDLIGIATSAIEADRFEIAELRLARARELAPNGLEPIFWSGVLAGRQGRFADALAWFDEVLSREESFGLAHLERGKVLLHQEAWPDAIKSLGRACELLPKNFEAYYNLGSVLLSGGDKKGALPYLIQAYALSKRDALRDRLHMTLSELVTGDPDTAMGLSRTAASNGDYEAALDWVQRTMEMHERIATSADANYLRADYLNQLDRPAEAETFYTRALSLNPEHFWASHNLGILLATKLHRPLEAEPHLRRVLQLLPDMKSSQDDIKAAIRGRMQSLLEGIQKAAGGSAPNSAEPAPPLPNSAGQ